MAGGIEAGKGGLQDLQRVAVRDQQQIGIRIARFQLDNQRGDPRHNRIRALHGAKITVRIVLILLPDRVVGAVGTKLKFTEVSLAQADIRGHRENTIQQLLSNCGRFQCPPEIGTDNNRIKTWSVPYLKSAAKEVASYYPPNRGFLGQSEKTVLQPGTKVDRYGFDGGTFVAPQGTPAPMRALPPGSTQKPYNAFEVTKPITVDGGTTAPAFGQIGLGTQYELPGSVSSLLKSGVLKRVAQ